MSRRPTTQRNPSRTGWPPRGRGGTVNISAVRIISSETMIAAKVKPLARKHHAVPIAPTSTAASAGPKIREPVMTAVFNDVAFGISCGSTSSVTRARRAGLSKALTVPSSSDRAKITGTLIAPLRSSRPSRIACAASADWVMIDIRRRLCVSATAPAHAPSSSIGRNCRPALMPTDQRVAVGDPVDEQRHRGELQPGADVRHGEPGEEQPGVAIAQRAEHSARSCRSSCRRVRSPARSLEPRCRRRRHAQSSSFKALMKTSPGTSTRPIDFIFFLPSFCFSSSLRLRVMSPP